MQQYGDLFYLPFCVGNAYVSALVDSGASKSFLSSNMVQALSDHLVYVEAEPLIVDLPNGQKIQSKGAYKLVILVENIDLEIIVHEVEMKQNFIFGSDFCQQFSVVVDFSTMILSLAVGSSQLAVQLLKEELALELNEVKELCTKNLENFCKPVSVK